jgi:preprotein translocase subunit SecE
VEKTLLALQRAHASQRDEVIMANAIVRVRDFTTEVVEELKKVTWPDFPQLKNATFVILVFIIIVSFIIWLMDLAVRGVVNTILDLFAG